MKFVLCAKVVWWGFLKLWRLGNGSLFFETVAG